VWTPPTPAPVASNASNLIDRGWGVVDRSPSQAAKYFKQALDMDSGNYDANLGYGYVLMKLDKLIDAQRYLCRARRSPVVETQREATQFLLNHGLTCH
jgi:Tfp pilus assembly protein PilF